MALATAATALFVQVVQYERGCCEEELPTSFGLNGVIVERGSIVDVGANPVKKLGEHGLARWWNGNDRRGVGQNVIPSVVVQCR